MDCMEWCILRDRITVSRQFKAKTWAYPSGGIFTKCNQVLEIRL